MHLHQLKYFVSIVDTGSMTRAAERCFVSQPSISQQLGKLEDSIGKKLFSRERGKLVLTDSGQVMYDQAKKILASVDEARRRVSEADDLGGGSVSIGVLPTLAPFMLPSALVALSAKYPGAMVTIREQVSEAIVAAAEQGEVDVLIEVLPFDSSRMNVVPLFTDDFFVAVHEDNPLARLDEITIDALEDMPFIMLEDVHCLARQIESYCFSKQFVPKVLFQASQLATVCQLVEMNYGVSVVPGICIDNDADSSIRYIALEGDKSAREVVLATAKDRHIGPAAEFFVSVIQQLYQTT